MFFAIAISVLTLALAGTAVLLWRLLRLARASRARTDAARERVRAGARLRDLLDRESHKAQLLRLDSVTSGADAFGLQPLTLGDDCSTWADRLFARSAGGGAQLHFDSERGHWTACVPLFEGGPVVAFAIDETDRNRPFEALRQALDIVAADAPPVVDAGHAPSSVCVRFDAGTGRWQAFQPCDACGGGWLSTTFDTPDHEPLARLSAGRILVDHDRGHEPAARSRGQSCLYCAAR